MILHRILERWLQSKEALVDGCGIVAVECDHLGACLAAADNLESVGLNSLYDRVGDGRRRLPLEKPNSGPARFDFIIGVSVPPG